MSLDFPLGVMSRTFFFSVSEWEKGLCFASFPRGGGNFGLRGTRFNYSSVYGTVMVRSIIKVLSKAIKTGKTLPRMRVDSAPLSPLENLAALRGLYCTRAGDKNHW